MQSPKASLFHVALSRGGEVFEELMPKGSFSGVLVSDFYGVYTGRKDLLHAYWGAHVIRKAKAIDEVEPTKVSREFADKLRALYKKGQAATDFDTRESVRTTFRWLTVHPRFGKHPEVDKLRRRIAKRFEGVVAFLGREDIPFTNNRTERVFHGKSCCDGRSDRIFERVLVEASSKYFEYSSGASTAGHLEPPATSPVSLRIARGTPSEREIRFACEYRKVTGGTQSDRGSMAFGHWMSVDRTVQKNGIDFDSWTALAFEAVQTARPLPSVFAQPP